jgi:hypothetical protein
MPDEGVGRGKVGRGGGGWRDPLERIGATGEKVWIGGSRAGGFA